MQIKELNMDHFGKFHDEVLTLKRGVNIIYGPNESGKSTMHSFIQCMLFGAERQRGRGAGKDMYSRYQPWELSGNYAGRLRFEYGGRFYRIIRNFHKEGTAYAVVDEGTGLEVLSGEETIDRLVENLTPVNYRNSISQGQMSGQVDEPFVSNMQSYMANMSMTGSDSVDVGAALARLKEEKKRVKAGFDEAAFLRLQQEAGQLTDALAGMEALSAQITQLEQEKAQVYEQMDSLEKEIEVTTREERSERMAAARLIEENNTYVRLYKEKKAEVRQLEERLGAARDSRELAQIMEVFEEKKDRLEDVQARSDELGQDEAGNVMKTLAIAFPIAIAALCLYLWGSVLGLEGVRRTLGIAICGALLALVLLISFLGAARRSARVRRYQREAQALEAELEEIRQQYKVASLKDLRNADKERERVLARMSAVKEEMERLRRKYEALQEPLAPYMEKFGDSLTLESPMAEKAKEKLSELKRRAVVLGTQLDQSEWKMEQMAAAEENLTKVTARIDEMKHRKDEMEEDLQALELAEKTISEVTARIHGTFGIRLGEYISRVLAMITDDKHQRLNVDEKFRVHVDDSRQILKPEQLSAGTADQIYFAVRIAVSQLLFHEPMPLILDDSFTLYDDERLERTLTWLAGQTAFDQIIIFTCHHREAEILKRNGIEYHMVEMR